MVHIILSGPPGCGKGTQAKIIANNFGFIHLSTGKIFRNHIKKNTDLGKIVAFYINKGELVPDIITTNIVNTEIKKLSSYKGIIYDGYPRTKNQIISLEKTLKKFSIGKISIIFFFLIDNKSLINRLLKRGKEKFRNDDMNITIIKKRIEAYNNETYFIWKNIKWKNIIMKLDASFSIKKLSYIIDRKINNLIIKNNL
ncbi:adenylate kinase family protein [Blattabacterium cuenoti]|uniref:adenylate kinase family protein n=1 Tax=Blattabacterium cuenoti TaxID=1653831 RepID=UPI00163BC461|nr:nucleoside monophosphate kinase [Blattabacterium cuenoti]